MPDLIYRPNQLIGEELFNGTPYVKQEVLDLIGFEGVGSIHKKIAKKIETRKEMFGAVLPKDYGLYKIQEFVDLHSRKYILLTSLKVDKTLKGNVQPHPELINESNENKYLLELWGDFNGPKRSRKSMIKYIQRHPIRMNLKQKIEYAENQVEFLKQMGRL